MNIFNIQASCLTTLQEGCVHYVAAHYPSTSAKSQVSSTSVSARVYRSMIGLQSFTSVVLLQFFIKQFQATWISRLRLALLRQATALTRLSSVCCIPFADWGNHTKSSAFARSSSSSWRSPKTVSITWSIMKQNETGEIEHRYRTLLVLSNAIFSSPYTITQPQVACPCHIL